MKYNEPRTNMKQKSGEAVDESKCDNCHEIEFHFFCKKCDEYLCIECNQDNHKRGDKALHHRIEAYIRNKSKKSLCCKVHGDQELRWYCSTCNHSICELCCDRNGAHSKHDFVLCRTIANDLKSEVSAKYLDAAESKKEPIINALKTLEAMLYEIGVEGVPVFGNAKPNHVSSWQRAVDEVRAHYAAIRHLAIEMEEKHVKEIAELAKAKSDAVMDHIKALHADLDQIANCSDAKEAMIASPDLEACASHSDVMALLNDLEAHMASIKITMNSSIQVKVCTSDVLRVLEKSCHVGGPSTPGEVLIEGVEIKDKAFEDEIVNAKVTATDVNGACSGKGVSSSVVLPDRFGPLVASLRYVSDFDQNGLLYYIGSAGGTRGYVNPHASGDVVVTWSSIGLSLSGFRVEHFVNNQFNNKVSVTDNIPGSWMMVDLGATRRISPNYYSLRHGLNNSNHCLYNWVIEGKMDDSDTSAWVVLREHVNDESIYRAGATCSWPVTNVGINQCFRYIRIRMTGVDSNGHHYLTCSGIELYGDLHMCA